MQDAVTAFHDECIGELEHMTSTEALQVRESVLEYMVSQFTRVPLFTPMGVRHILFDSTDA